MKSLPKRIGHWVLLLVVPLGAALLSACSRLEATPLVVPTSVVEIAIHEAGPVDAGVPATWTPEPVTQHADVRFNQLGSAGPTNTPSPTSIFPTRTPIPPTATPIPPTSTPGPNIPYVFLVPTLPPTDELGPSKLGLHVVRNNDANIMEFVRQTQPAVMKAVDDLGFLAEVKEVSPNTVTVGRINVMDGPHYHVNPEQSARDFVATHLEDYLLNPAVDYWEGYNEPDPNHENMLWYARFESERVRVMAEHGLKSAIGGFATGVPEYDEFRSFLSAIAVAKAHGGILTLHEYAAPDITYLYGDPLPGLAAYPDRGSLMFRYRWLYEDMLLPAGLDIPLVISEAGIDGMIGGRPGPEGLGWADFQDYWVSQGWADNGVQAFVNQLAWYDAGVRRDGYVIGFTVFTAGGIGFWENYDINPILPQITNYVGGQR